MKKNRQRMHLRLFFEHLMLFQMLLYVIYELNVSGSLHETTLNF